MKISSNITIITASILTSFLLIGCGSDSNSSSTTTSTFDGQLVDSYVENVDYICGDGVTGITDIDGRFSCESLPIKFKIGGIELGELTNLPIDKQVFPQDLVGVDRNDTTNEDVKAMARLLQSCDEDSQARNGIKIQERVRANLNNMNEKFDAQNLQTYVDTAEVVLADENTSVEHLEDTTEFVDAVNDASSVPAIVKDALLTPSYTLSQEVKNTLAYMGNEERLAHDVYMKLYEFYPLTQFINVATNGERSHIESVQLLIQKYISSYDEFTNIDLPELGYKEAAIEDMNSGVYDISDIQNLYDSLIVIGQQSEQDALEVGCMIEVTDINDLLEDIELAEESGATDVVTTFEFLRDGSYSHYWAFDKALVSMGIAEGCCVAGAEYCHPEYPQNSTGGGSGDAPHDGTGQQKGKN